MSEPTPRDRDMRRFVALTLAVIHHAASNFAADAVPPGWETVLKTADGFRNWLDGNPTPQPPSRNRRQ